MVVKNNIETRTLTSGAQSYRAIITYRDALGKKVNLTSSFFRDIQQAQTALIELKSQIDSIREKDKTEITGNTQIEKAFTLFYDRNLRHQHEPRTQSSWQQTSRWLRHQFGVTRLRTLSQAQIKKVAKKYALTHTTDQNGSLARHLMHLNALLKYATEHKIIAENPLPSEPLIKWFGQGMRRRQENNLIRPVKHRVFYQSEMASIRDYLLKQDYTQPADKTASRIALLIMAYTGIRPGEAQALKHSSIIRTKDNRIKFNINDSWDEVAKFANCRTKTGTNRISAALPKSASEAVETFLIAQQEKLADWNITAADPYILLNTQDPRKAQDSLPISQNAMNKMLKQLIHELKMDRPDLEIVSYTLRHTFATELSGLVNGRYEIAAALMGHTTSTYIQTYLNVQDDLANEIADSLFS